MHCEVSSINILIINIVISIIFIFIPTCIYLKLTNLTMTTLEEGVNLFKVNNNDTRSTSLMSFWYLYC